MSKRKPDEEKLRLGFRLVVEGLGLDLSNPHIAETPERAARAWYHELCSGITHGLPKITTFPSDMDEMVMLRAIPIRSLCMHHLLPFYGHATIAYIPGAGKIFGVSKLSRIADYWARRPQVQEQLTAQIADHIAELVMGPPQGPVHEPENALYRGGVGVIIRANHMCMELRGVQHEGDMVTSALRGIFRESFEVRTEFLRLAGEDRSIL